MSLPLPFVVRDPVHGLMAFTELERELIDLPIFQRLRGLKQSSLAHLTYPSALTSRFEHSLGVAHVSGRIIAHLESNYSSVYDGLIDHLRPLHGPQLTPLEFRSALEQGVRLAALFHDIGHLPFSHCFEKDLQFLLIEPRYAERWGKPEADSWNSLLGVAAGTRRSAPQFHEFLGVLILETHPDILAVLDREIDAPLRRGAHGIALDILDPRRSTQASDAPLQNTLGRVVHGEIDADRLDFVRRDIGMAGTSLASFDSDRLIHSFALMREGSSFEVLPSIRGLSAVEAFLLARLATYRWQYHHPNVVYHDLLLRLLVRGLLRDGYHGLVQDTLIERLSIESFRRIGDTAGGPDNWIFIDDGLILSQLMELRRSVLAARVGDPENTKLERTLIMTEEVLFRRKRRVALWKDHMGYLTFAREYRAALKLQLQERLEDVDDVVAEHRVQQCWPAPAGPLDAIVQRLKGAASLEAIQDWLWANGCPWVIVDSKEVQMFRRSGGRRGMSELKLLGRPGEQPPKRTLNEVSAICDGFGDSEGKELRFFAFELLSPDVGRLNHAAREERAREARARLAKSLAAWACSGPNALVQEDAIALGLTTGLAV